MIDYTALAESASVILPIYFVAVGVVMPVFDKAEMLPATLDAYRKWAIVVFIPFSIAIIMALMNAFYSIILFVASMIALGIALEQPFTLLSKLKFYK